MGGQSFQCPICNEWKLTKGSLSNHIKDKHKLKDFTIEGTGPLTTIKPATASVAK